MASTSAIFQKSFYIANNFNAILYGIELMLYFGTVWLVVKGRKGHRTTHGDRRFLYFSTALLCLITIFVAVQAVFREEMWIVNAEYSGGSSQYFVDNAAVWYETLGIASCVVLSLLSDGFLIYRTYVVWSDWRVVVFPSILYLGSAALGILTCYTSGQPNSNFFSGVSAKIALSYSAVVIGLNFTCTTLICSRILMVAKRMEQTLGRSVSKTFTGVASLIIESMLPYTLFGMAYLITLGLNHPTEIFFLSLYAMFTCISPQMIVIRVLMGRGWTKDATSRSIRQLVASSAPVQSDSSWTYSGSDRTEINLRNLSKSDDSSPEVNTMADSKV